MKISQSSRLALNSLKYTSLRYRSSKPGNLSISSIRYFHASPRRQFVDECLIQTHALLCGLHNITGLPWAASIPLTAFLIQGVVLLPLDMYGLALFKKAELLRPKLDELRPTIEKEVARAHMGRSALEKQRIVEMAVDYHLRIMAKQRGVQRWKSYLIFIRVPIWLVVMETLRRSAGVEDGILGLIGKSLTGRQCVIPDVPIVDVIPVEHAFKYEGMLWFPDLLLPDPALILPFLLSGVLFFSRGTISFANPIRPHSPSSWGRNIRIQRASMMLALAAGPATLQFPTAMLLYACSYGTCSVIVKYTMRWLKPFAFTETKNPSDTKKQQYRGPTMGDVRKQKKTQHNKK